MADENKKNYSEMTHEELAAYAEQRDSERGIYQDMFKTQLEREYESAPTYIKERLKLDDLVADPMTGLSQFKSAMNLYNEIADDVKKSAPPKKDPTSASPNASSQSGGTEPPKTFMDAVKLAFPNMKK